MKLAGTTKQFRARTTPSPLPPLATWYMYSADHSTDFQAKVQEFLNTHSSSTPQIQWLQNYRTPAKAKGPNGEPLKWDTKDRKWYYMDAKTKKAVNVPFKNP